MKKAKHSHRWVGDVKTVSTFPPEGTFSKDARTVARIMARKEVSPKGIGSGIRMIQYFINRGGKGLSASRKMVLHRAIEMLQEKQAKTAPHKSRSKQSKGK